MSSEDRLAKELSGFATKICAARGWALGEALGAGGTAAVYDVVADGRPCALKVYHPRFLDGSRGASTRRRFDIALTKLKGHECTHLVAIHDGGELCGTLYLLMAKVPGARLTDALDRVPRTTIRKILDHTARAALFLEGLGLCHRDIKSDNIVVSDDFSQATLLDLGVVREINDDVGAGTDDEGQLPFVATARYSSPEYMFRLAPPSPRLWQALTFYQLGAVLHDLIMRTPIFEEVVKQSRDNRYLIAHAVATKTPLIVGEQDVPLDLVIVAQRALDKDIDRRLKALTWDDFLDQENERRRFEVVLGLQGEPVTQSKTKKRQIQLQNLGDQLHRILDGRLIERTIHAKNEKKKPGSGRMQIRYTWSPPTLPGEGTSTAVLELQDNGESLQIDVWGEFSSRGSSWTTDKFPACMVPMPADASVPPALVECSLDAVLRAFTQIVNQLRAQNA